MIPNLMEFIIQYFLKVIHKHKSVIVRVMWERRYTTEGDMHVRINKCFPEEMTTGTRSGGEERNWTGKGGGGGIPVQRSRRRGSVTI